MSHRVVRLANYTTDANEQFVAEVEAEMMYYLGTKDLELWWSGTYPASVVVSDDEFAYEDDERVTAVFNKAVRSVMLNMGPDCD